MKKLMTEMNLIAQIEEKVPYIELEEEKSQEVLEDDKGSDCPGF